MNTLNYNYEFQKEHIDIGFLIYQDSDENQLFIATLELFGNGYELKLYEGDEFQSTKNGVVLNTSYEFIQYVVDDSDSMRVSVNDEIFIMSEQQFELIKTYYDILGNSTSKVNTSRPIKNVISAPDYKSAGEYFDEDDELYYVYDEILSDPKNIRLRVKLAYHLMEEIQNFERIKTIGDISKYMSLCEENLIEIINVNSRKDKRLFFAKLIAMSQLGCVYALRGRLDDSVKFWHKALEEVMNSNLKNNFCIDSYIAVNALNIQFVLNYLKEEFKLKMINLKYEEYIHRFCNSRIELYQSWLNKETVGSTFYEHIINQLKIAENLEKNCDHFVMIEYDMDDFEYIHYSIDPEDEDFDEYNFSILKFKNIEDDLKASDYKYVFEKNESEINKQKMRIRAYL